MQVFDKAAVRQQLKNYLELGFSPIPLRGKVANYHWKEFKLTMSNMEQYLKPYVNWGIRTDLLPCGTYFYVVDIDVREEFSSFYEANSIPKDVPIVSSGEGFHFYLSWKEPVKTRHSSEIEIIANGYVVCPPSIHASGKPYRFIAPLKSYIPEVDPDTLLFPYHPEPLRKLLLDDGGCISQYSLYPFDWHSIYDGVPKGQRHNTLIRYLGILFARYDEEDEALTKAINWNRLNNPPLSEGELLATVENCYSQWTKQRDEEFIDENEEEFIDES